MKFVSTVSYHSGCPMHDSSSTAAPLFWNDLSELLEYVKKNMNEYSVEETYRCDTGEVSDVSVTYESGPRGHVYHGAKVTTAASAYQLVDDGSGGRVWKDITE